MANNLTSRPELNHIFQLDSAVFPAGQQEKALGMIPTGDVFGSISTWS
jgi:hypothetical protein